MIMRPFLAGLLIFLCAGAGCVRPSNDAAGLTVSVPSRIAVSLARGETLEKTAFHPINLPVDVNLAQVGTAYRLGNSDESTLFLFVLQKNMNVPLLNLPDGVETTWGGVLASADGGEHWERFLSYENPRVEFGMVRANPVGMFIDAGVLYVDVADALGAGSGEGYMTRFVLGSNGKKWSDAGCYYYVQEKYTPTKDTKLAASTNCLIVP